jgi:alkylresorcinol/alkylpyrone synthase
VVTRRDAATITGIGTSVPGTTTQEELWEGFFAAHFGHRRGAKLAFHAAGLTTRHAAVNPLIEDVSQWSTGARMERYLTEAMPLGKEALTGALDAAGLRPEQVGLFAVASCTGYATPGLDVRLARDIAMAPSLQRLSIGHVGCHAALPALGAMHDYVIAHGKPAVLLCVELSSLHVQPPTTDLEQVVIHSLFSDAACAVVVEPGEVRTGSGLDVVDLIARTDVGSIDDMTWHITDLGFRMTLSRTVSDAVAKQTAPLVADLLERNAMSMEMVDAWAVHPGGPRILEAVGDRLHLNSEQLAASQHVLNVHGNCSSATILLVLEGVWRALGPAPGRNVVALAFGPGLTLYAALLRTT